MKQRYFTLLVVGDNPDEIIKRYDSHEVEPYLLFEYKKATEYYNTQKKIFEELCIQYPDNENYKIYLEDIKSITPIDYYLDITSEYDLDDDGNVYSTVNPMKKFEVCRIMPENTIPLINKKGEETYSANVNDIDWAQMHLYNTKPYEVAWDTVMEHKKPANKDEKKIYDNMKNRVHYFQHFGTREKYIVFNTAFWTYAYLDNNGWQELDENIDQIKWVENFYEKFILPLKHNEKLTIYTCFRN